MGLLRLVLALNVVIGHCGSGANFFGLYSMGGRRAVCLFYIISGFYMAMILNKKYVGLKSVRLFYLNRWLRLWPTYLISAIVAIVILFINNQAGAFWTGLQSLPLAPRLCAIFSNFFILGQDFFYLIGFDKAGHLLWAPYESSTLHNGTKFLLNGPAFSISIEMYFYLLAPFIVRSFRRSLLFFTAGALYQLIIYYGFNLTTLAWTYQLFLTSFIYFGAGILTYHISQMKPSYQGYIEYGLALMVVALLIFSNLLIQNLYLLFFILAVPVIFNLTRKHRLDRMIGELSYSVYILHMPLLALIRPRVGVAHLGTIAGLCVIGAGVLLYVFIESPLNKFRERLVDAPRDVGAPGKAAAQALLENSGELEPVANQK